jgi:U4/U6.U5 tri-snRNP-associated protein 1
VKIDKILKYIFYYKIIIINQSIIVYIQPNMNNDKIPQMTMNSDGTMSLSIEETNALRIKIGLKPLQETKIEKKLSENETHKPAQKQVDVEDIKSRIEKSKWLRKERELKRIKTLGESSEEDSEEDAASFVEKSRKLEKEKQLAKEKMKKMQEEEEEREKNAVDLTGMIIAHDQESFTETPIILTLADKDIMDDGEDELENINMMEEEKRIYNKKQEKRSFSYNVFDSIDNPDSAVLNQYDNETFEESKKKFRLNEVKKDEIKMNDPSKTIYDLDEEKKFMNEYKSEKVKIKKRKIKEKQIRSSTIESDVTVDQKNDHGSRRRNHVEDEDMKSTNEIQREKGYQIAMEKAEMKSKFLLNSHKDEIDQKIQRQASNNTSNVNSFIENISEKIKEISNQEEEELKNSNVKYLNPTAEFVKTIKLEKKIEVKPTVDKMEEEKEELKIKIPSNQHLKSEKEDNAPSHDVFEEPNIGSGLAAALQFADQYLDKKSEKPKTKVIQYQNEEVDFGGPEILIERKDRFGQVMNEKKTWRQMSQKFHNKLPGKNKLEKERRAFEQQQKIKNMSATDTPLKSVETLNKIQQKTGLAYVEFGNTGIKRKENPSGGEDDASRKKQK